MQALVGGADCGPVNPLAQLSKTFASDRGAQQDQFSSQAGPSRSGFRRGGQGQGPAIEDEAARFFQAQAQQQQPQGSRLNHLQAFDLAPLGRALTPQQQATPEWAQAFVQSTDFGGTMEGHEREAFEKAFHGPGPAAAPQWAADFANQQHRDGNVRSPESQQQQQRMFGGAQQSGFRPQQQMMGLGRVMPTQVYPASAMQLEGSYDQAAHRQRMETQSDQSTDWETAFLAQESSQQAQPATIPQSQTAATSVTQEPRLSDSEARDALAQTAGELLNTVRNTESQRTGNDKFANSTFLDLMRKLRDGEVAVEGDKVVEQVGPASSAKGKGKARADNWANDFGREEEGRVGAQVPSSGYRANMAPSETFQRSSREMDERNRMVQEMERGYADVADLWTDEDRERMAREATQQEGWRSHRKVQFQGDGGVMDDDDISMQDRMRADTSVPMANANWEEDFDASMISGGHAVNVPRTTNLEPSAQQKEWETLQNDWDAFEATSTGFTPVASTSTTQSGYAFSQNNPYVHSTRTHSLHSHRSTYDSILEQEAAVQSNPNDPKQWLALGIKQQENEREEMAIKALTQALSLDPNMGDAYLALAVSYTNENERGMAYDAIDKWIDTLGTNDYPREVENYRDLFGQMPRDSLVDSHAYLTGLLIQMAQTRAERDGKDVDANVQIGLGVLFNTSEEYEKASDCFESALSVRPDDPLLFNRLGATLANAGKTDLAIQYYLEALDLQPTYVRARFNLAVANMNLQAYEQAIEHLMTALSIQEADAELKSGEMGQSGHSDGVTSQTLWDSLNIALLMIQRSDLASMTADRDLASLRMSNKIVPAVYRNIMDDVINNVRTDFDEVGVEEAVLQELLRSWESKVAQSRVADFQHDTRMGAIAKQFPMLASSAGVGLQAGASGSKPVVTPKAKEDAETPEGGKKKGKEPKEGADDDEINSDLDDSDDEVNDDDEDGTGDSGHLVIALYEKVQRVKNKWKVTLKDGLVSVNGKEYLFAKCSGEFEW